MTIIQALKKIKQLTRKIQRTNERIDRWGSYFNDEDPLYTDINKMIQSVSDMNREIGRIRHAMHKLNATHKVSFAGKEVTIDELLIEANVVIPAQIKSLRLLRRREKGYGHDNKDVKVVLQYNPKERDIGLDALEDRQASINDLIDELNIELQLDI